MTYHFDYSKIDVEDYLHELGLTNIVRKGNEYWFSCPLSGHMGVDSTPSASMEIDTTRMYCFGCGFSGNAVSFLAEYEGVSPLKARKWLRERFNMTFFEPKDTFSGEIDLKFERQEKRKLKKGAVPHHSTLLDEREVEKRSVDWYRIFDLWQGKIEEAYPLAYMLDRGFHPNTLTEWAIGWDMISQRISIPIRDEFGNLIGFKARAVDDNPQRYKVLGGPEYGFETYGVSKALFGIDRAKEYDTLIIREGELNAIAIWEAGYKNVVGSGKILSDFQLDLIKKYAQKVILWFDDFRDNIGATQQLEMNMPVKVCKPYDRDPSDMFKDEIVEAIEESMTTVLL